MAVVALTEAYIGRARPDFDEVFSMVAGATITKGQAVYIDTDGEVVLSDASISGTAKFVGIALNGAAAGQYVTVLSRGLVYGYTLGSLNYGVQIFLSDTTGALDTAAGTVSIAIGKVFPLEGERVLMVDANHTIA